MSYTGIGYYKDDPLVLITRLTRISLGHEKSLIAQLALQYKYVSELLADLRKIMVDKKLNDEQKHLSHAATVLEYLRRTTNKAYHEEQEEIRELKDMDKYIHDTETFEQIRVIIQKLLSELGDIDISLKQLLDFLSTSFIHRIGASSAAEYYTQNMKSFRDHLSQKTDIPPGPELTAYVKHTEAILLHYQAWLQKAIGTVRALMSNTAKLSAIITAMKREHRPTSLFMRDVMPS